MPAVKPKVVEPDVPQALLDMANELDWTRVSRIQIRTFAPILRTYIKVSLKLPLKPAKRERRSDPTKLVCGDVPQELLDAFNSVEWLKMTPEEISTGLDRLRREGLPKLPIPKKVF